MRNYLLIFFILILTIESIAQKVDNHRIGEDSVVEFPDIQASYPGGEIELQKFLASNLRYPVICLDSGIQGRIFMKFIIEKDGSISNIEVVKNTTGCEDFGNDAARVIGIMPRWKPAVLADEPKRSICHLPIIFRFN